jgi:hypothetical protein
MRGLIIRHPWFAVWLCFTALWLLLPLFDGDVALILVKYRIGGWRLAFSHSLLAALIGILVPATVLSLAWIGIRMTRRLRAKMTG